MTDVDKINKNVKIRGLSVGCCKVIKKTNHTHGKVLCKDQK